MNNECFKPFPPETHCLTRYLSQPLPERVEVFQYRVVARRLAASDEASVLAKLAFRLSGANYGIPVVRLSGRTLASFEALDNLASGRAGIVVEALGKEALNYRTGSGRRALLRLLRAAIKRRAQKHGFVVGISDFILSPRFRLTDSNRIVGLQTGVVFDLAVGQANRVIVDCDMRSKILRREPVSSRLSDEPEWDPRGLAVTSPTVGETFFIEEILEQKVGEPDKLLGCSVIEYNRSQGRYRDGFDPDPSCPVAVCRVGDAGKRYHYDTQLIYEILDLRAVRAIDKEFARRLADATRMDMAERERFCTYFIGKVCHCGPDWFHIRPEATVVGRGNSYGAFDMAYPRDNLVFDSGRGASSIEKGVVECGLFSGPGSVALASLLPSGHEKGGRKLLGDLLDGLNDLARGKADFGLVFEQVYNPRNPFRIRDAVARLSSSGAELALVVLPPRSNRGSPYYTLKAELAEARFPSQMLHRDIHLSRRELANILVGLTSKLGRSMNWSLRQLLWPPDLFIGISSAEVDEERMAAVATAFDRNGAALDVTVEIFAGKGDAISESRLLHLLEGATLAYRNVHSVLPAAVVIHRDGEFHERTIRRVWKHFEELDVSMTLVAVDVGLPPRMARLGKGVCKAPRPGTLVLFNEHDGLVITTAPLSDGRGAPRPVGFRRVSGLIEMKALGGHIFWLSRVHQGSIRPPRLPVTVHFARKVIGMVRDGLVPQGTMGSKMLFV